MKKITILSFYLMIPVLILSRGTIQLSDNEYHSVQPQIHNGQVVWQGWDGNDWEIFYWDGSSVTQLTHNDENDRFPHINNGRITWMNDLGVFFWDGTSISHISDNIFLGWFEEGPLIENHLVVWRGQDREVYLWDGLTIKRLTTDAFYSQHVRIHNGQVVWAGTEWEYELEQDTEIYFWDGVSTTRLTDNEFDDFDPNIHNGQIVWIYEGQYEVRPQTLVFWNGESIIHFPEEYIPNGDPQIYNGHIVWAGWREGKLEIFFWDGTNIQQLTDNDLYDDSPRFNDDYIVWYGGDPGDYSGLSDHYSIYLFHDGTTTNISEEIEENGFLKNWSPELDNNLVVWQGTDKQDMWQIFLSYPRTHSRPFDKP